MKSKYFPANGPMFTYQRITLTHADNRDAYDQSVVAYVIRVSWWIRKHDPEQWQAVWHDISKILYVW